MLYRKHRILRGSLSSMNYARLSSLLCATALGAVLAASCASTHDTADVVPSPPGAVQPDAGGKSVDEATACAKVTGAESSARAALSCEPVVRTCPNYIRPAGSNACFLYDEASVDGCVTLFNSFTSCAEFDEQPCLVTAEPCDSGTSSGGAGDQGGAAGSDSGAAGSDVPGAGGASAAGSSD
jgi:hypothetical protein